MRVLSTRTVAVIAGVALVVVGILTTYMFLELGKSNDLLADTRATLTETTTALNDTSATLQETSSTLDTQIANNNDLAQANAAFADANSVLTGNLNDALGAIDEWQVAFADKEKDLEEANADLAQTKTELASTAMRLTESRNSLGALTSEHRRLQDTYGSLLATEATLRRNYNSLAEQYGDVEALQDQAKVLREEIAELEVMRRPLILSTERGTFACTGSMEPKITCLDEATWIDNPRPGEIVIGAVISFSPGCGDNGEKPGYIAHRVIDIKVENEVYSYWPKGDASDEPDNCWVPFANVRAYIVEIHKDARPENAELRDSVKDARAKVDEAWVEYHAAEEAYFAIIERYCGVGVNPRDCELPSPQYEIAISAHGDLEYALEVLEGRNEHYGCWLESAATAIYREGGESPLYKLCVPYIPPLRFN